MFKNNVKNNLSNKKAKKKGDVEELNKFENIQWNKLIILWEDILKMEYIKYFQNIVKIDLYI